jgi:hypothetical protein
MRRHWHAVPVVNAFREESVHLTVVNNNFSWSNETVYVIVSSWDLI